MSYFFFWSLTILYSLQLLITPIFIIASDSRKLSMLGLLFRWFFPCMGLLYIVDALRAKQPAKIEIPTKLSIPKTIVIRNRRKL